MHWHNTPFAALLVTASGLLFALAAVAWQQQRTTHGARPFAVLACSVAVWTLAYGLRLAADDLASKVFWLKAQYLGIATAAWLWLLFVLRYTGRDEAPTRRLMLLLALEPLATAVIAVTAGSQGLLWHDARVDASGAMGMLAYQTGPWFWLHVVYSYLLMLAGMVLLLNAFITASNLVRHQVTILLVATAIPMAGNIVDVTEVGPVPHLELTPFAFAASLVVTAAGLWFYRLLDIVPIARDAVVESMPDSLVVLDAQNRIVDVNPAAESLFQQPAHALIGRPAVEFAGDRMDLVDAYLDAPSTEAEIALGPEDFPRWYSLRVAPLWDSDGALRGRFAIFSDITSRKLTEEALLASRGRFQAIFDNAGIGIALTDVQGRSIMSNAALHDMLGYSAEELREMSFDKFTHPADVAADMDLFQQLLDGEIQDYQLEKRYFRKDGGLIWARLTISLAQAERGDEAFAIAMVEDITEQKRTEERLAQILALSEALHRGLDPEQVLEEVVRGAVDLGFTRAIIHVCDPATSRVQPQAVAGFADHERDALMSATYRVSDFEALMRDRFQMSQSYFIPQDEIDWGQDFRGHISVSEMEDRGPDHWRPGDMLLVPLWGTRGEPVGFLSVDQTAEGVRPSEHQVRVLETFARQAAVAIENAMLFDALQQRAEEAETLRESGAAVAATLNLDEAITRILEQLERVVPYDSASVQLLRDNCVEIVGGRGWSDQETVIGLRFPIPADNPNTVVIRERRPYILGHAPQAHADFDLQPHAHIQSWLGVPLIVRDEIIGMLSVDSREPDHFTPAHARLAAAFADQVAIALANARLFEVEKRRRRELETLHQASLHLTSSLQLQAVLEAILKHALQLVAGDDAHIFLYEDDELSFGAATWADEVHAEPYAEPRRDGLTYTVARTGKRLVIRDVDAHPLFKDWQWGGAIIGLPLRSGDRVRGVMNIAFAEPYQFDDDEVRVLELLADQAAIAIENARLYTTEQRRREVAAALSDISRVASSSLELKQMLKELSQRTASACHASRCSIFLIDRERCEIRPAMSQFADGRSDAEQWQKFQSMGPEPLDELPLMGNVIRRRQPVLLDNRESAESVPRTWMETFGAENALVAPLVSHGEVIGLMVLDHVGTRREFSPEVVELASMAADRVAAAIENARLYASMQQLAITDSLTGLHNRRGFFELGQREMERARRFERPLVVMMFDLDDFKQINDLHGHVVGDQVLAGLADLCRQRFRHVDLLARYGGEEFTVLLPETPLATAHGVAERVRREIDRHAFDTAAGPIRVTVSFGVTAMHNDGKTLSDLVDCADRALYAAKQAGKNRVVVREQCQSRITEAPDI